MDNDLLSLIIDPGGIPGGRPGINLRVYPSGEVPIKSEYRQESVGRTANAKLVQGGLGDLQDFSCTFHLAGPEFQSLYGLDIATKTGNRQRTNSEIVVYNLVQPFTEIVTARTRYKVPGTSLIESVSLGGGYTRFSYWIAIQGTFEWTYKQKGSLYECEFKFTEGTKLTSTME